MDKTPEYVHHQFRCAGASCPQYTPTHRERVALCQLSGEFVHRETDDAMPEWCHPALQDFRRDVAKRYPGYRFAAGVLNAQAEWLIDTFARTQARLVDALEREGADAAAEAASYANALAALAQVIATAVKL